MLSAQEGLRTFMVVAPGITNPSVAFRMIRQALPPGSSAAGQARSVRMRVDGKGAAFDVPAEHASAYTLAASEAGNACPRIEEITELPELVETDAERGGGGGGRTLLRYLSLPSDRPTVV